MLRQVVWGWLEAHWNVVSVIGGVTVTVLLLVTAALPPLLAPLVLGPLAAVVLTALIAPPRKVTRSLDAPRGVRAPARAATASMVATGDDRAQRAPERPAPGDSVPVELVLDGDGRAELVLRDPGDRFGDLSPIL